MSETGDRIRRFIADTFFMEGFADDASFLRDGIVDSTGMMELVLFLEQEFGVKVADNELVPANLDSVARVAAFVARKQSRAVGA